MADLGTTEIVRRLADQCYVADRGLASALSVASQLRRPLFLEGEAGVGKTEVAKSFAAPIDARLIRLQCCEGIDVA
jgi:MoxR-like ATPase